VQGDDIIVPGTSYVVTYYRPRPSLSNFSPNPTQAERIRMPRRKPSFTPRAWKLANAKAHELGWIV
jgi:hypothetical protein